MDHLHPVKRGARCDEKGFVVLSPEADVGSTLRHLDGLEFFAIGIVHVHITVCGVQVAFHVFWSSQESKQGRSRLARPFV